MHAPRLLRCLLALAATGIAAAQDPCSMDFTVTLRNFNAAGGGSNSNPDYGFLPEPANVVDKQIVKPTLAPGAEPAYKPATGFNTTTTHSKTDFDQWWQVGSAFQQDAVMTLDQTEDNSGAAQFEFNSAEFWPLDGQLLGAGDPPGTHNRYFTMELRTNLKYLRASAGVLGFTTNCDLFVYMNGELVVNLGGVHASQAATLTLTQLGLQDGVLYPVDIFLAQRHGPGATPSLDLTSSVEFASGKRTAAYCSGAAGGGGNGTTNSTDPNAYPQPEAPPADGFPGVAGCNSVWGVAEGDTCAKIASKSGLESAASVLALNPGLNCDALKSGQLVCTGTGGAPTATCGFSVYATSPGDTCLAVRNAFANNGVPIKFAVLSALNPDVNCGSTGQSALPAGTNICLPQVPGSSAGAGRRRLQGDETESSEPVLLPMLSGGGAVATAAGAAVQSAATTSYAGSGLMSVFQGFNEAREEYRRSLQQAGAGTCIGTTFTVQQSGCSVNCASAAAQVGLTATQLTLLNPQLLNNPSKTCRVSAGQTLCRGCSGTVCGVKLSDTLSEFLNFPDLNLRMCGLLADCGNKAYLQGAPETADEQLTITITKQSASTRAYTAAGGSQIAAFFDPVDGYATTNPGSELTLSIYPNYYSGVAKVAKGGNAGLIAWIATVVLPDGTTGSTQRRKLQGFRLPLYNGKNKYRQRSQNPRTMVISRWRRIW